MSIEDNGTSQTGSAAATNYSFTESYVVDYVSSTTYKVTITELASGENINYTVWVLKNGTALAIGLTAGGFSENLTGSQAQSLLIGAFAGFTLQIQADSYIGAYTGSSYFHSTGTSTVSIGPTQVSVTTYAANTLPETVTSCGVDTTLTAFSFSVGTPQGSNVPLVVYEHFAGTDVVNGQTNTYDDVLQVTSVTLA